MSQASALRRPRRETRFVLGHEITLRPPLMRAAESERVGERVEVIGSNLAQGRERTLALERDPHRLYSRDRSQPSGHRSDQSQQGRTDRVAAATQPPHRARQLDLGSEILGGGFDALRLGGNHHLLDLVQAADHTRSHAVRQRAQGHARIAAVPPRNAHPGGWALAYVPWRKKSQPPPG